MLTPEQSVLVAIVACLAGAALTLVVARNKVAAGWVAFGDERKRGGDPPGGGGSFVAWAVGASGGVLGMPRFGFALRIYVDGLTAVFLLLASVIAVPAAFYSILYMRHYREYGVGRYYRYFLLFLAAMLAALDDRHDVVLLYFLVTDDVAGIRADSV